MTKTHTPYVTNICTFVFKAQKSYNQIQKNFLSNIFWALQQQNLVPNISQCQYSNSKAELNDTYMTKVNSWY